MDGYGEPIRFELSSADASTAAALTLYRAGSNTAYTLGANERVILQTVVAYISGALTLDIFDDVNGNGTVDTGDRLVTLGPGTFVVPYYNTDEGMSGGVGRVPKVKASGAGQINITGVGIFVKG